MTNLDIFEMNITLLAKVDNGAQEIKQAFKTLERLKKIDQILSGKLLMVLGGNLDTDLKILSNVGLHHSPDALEGVVHGERAKVVDQPVGVQHVGVDHGTLDVIDVSVVFQCSLKETCLLA